MPVTRVCPHCAAMTETDADRCPHCGKPFRRGGARVIAAAIVVAALAGAGIAIAATSGDDNTPATAPTPAATLPPETDKLPADDPKPGSRSLSYRQAYKLSLKSSYADVVKQFGPPLPPNAGGTEHPQPGLRCVYYGYYGRPRAQFSLCFTADDKLANLGTRFVDP
jgi:hypothetical protein